MGAPPIEAARQIGGPAIDRLIFVYGSLSRGEANHHQLAGSAFVGEGTVRDHALYLADQPYPYAAPLAGGRIAGEVYRVGAATARFLDEFEGSDGYLPRPVWVRLTTGQLVAAEIYAVTPDRIAALGARRYPRTRWRSGG